MSSACGIVGSPADLAMSGCIRVGNYQVKERRANLTAVELGHVRNERAHQVWRKKAFNQPKSRIGQVLDEAQELDLVGKISDVGKSADDADRNGPEDDGGYDEYRGQ